MKKRGYAKIKLRDAPPAALAIASILGAQEPRTGTAEMTPCPNDRHALAGQRPFAGPPTTPFKCE